ncbi:hypothetical protein BVRB_040250 [Beta vulgaris subsp. vulgaris]|uniref:Uncharacterized protein n=1 Tax=Beta vulgaris subsp. vulgaris TaxID=3555 RepID=A0A0J7YN62_BETVV|nr:hypothetical protein BVRB_040250 [Beta vulgaris subsp. vulgaris]
MSPVMRRINSCPIETRLNSLTKTTSPCLRSAITTSLRGPGFVFHWRYYETLSENSDVQWVVAGHHPKGQSAPPFHRSVPFRRRRYPLEREFRLPTRSDRPTSELPMPTSAKDDNLILPEGRKWRPSHGRGCS